jgi:hypothetical protein
MNKSHISIDEYDISASPPRAVVILLGWWGAQMKHVQKYSSLYQERNCATVTAVVESKAILTLDLYTLEAFAQNLASQTATVVREMEKQANNNEGKKIPVMIHSFSNGGAYPLWRLEVLIERAMMEKNVTEIKKTQDLLLIGNRLRGEIFDSAPCFPDNESAWKAMKHSISNIILRNIFRVTLLIQVFVVHVYRILFNKSDPRMDFWKHVTESRLCLNQAYVYSAMDEIANVKMLDELVSTRQGYEHAQILVKKFDDSEHVQHLRKYQSEYCELMDTFLDLIQEKSA